MKKILMITTILSVTILMASGEGKCNSVKDKGDKDIQTIPSKPDLKGQLQMCNNKIQEIAKCSKIALEEMDKEKMNGCKKMIKNLNKHINKYKLESGDKYKNKVKKEIKVEEEESKSMWSW